MNQNDLMRGVTYEKEGFSVEEKWQYEKELLEYIAYRINDYDMKTSHLEESIRPYLYRLAFDILEKIDGGCGYNTQKGYLLIPDPECHHDNPRFSLPENLYKYDIGCGNLSLRLDNYL